MVSIIRGAIEVVFSSKASVSKSTKRNTGSSYTLLVIVPHHDGARTNFSSIHLDHKEISSSQRSTGRSFCVFLNPNEGILPSRTDWIDSSGAEGREYLSNS
jgi:hypothetical protein